MLSITTVYLTNRNIWNFSLQSLHFEISKIQLAYTRFRINPISKIVSITGFILNYEFNVHQ